MCGIVGFIDFNKRSDYKILKNMTDVLYQRGPDDSGYSFYRLGDCNIGLGHRRLSILDLSSHGRQPMKFENLEIVYNGEVYNFKEIRVELEKYGYSFESNSDTEVILKAYHKWKIDAVHKFNGMFAIAIFDRKKDEIILIRDRAGVKPLYYYHKDGLFMFASELKSFHQNPYFKKSINQESLVKYLQFGYIPQPLSIFQNVYKLEAGYYLTLKIVSGRLKNEKYWDIDDFYQKNKLNISFDEAKEEVEKLLIKAFKYRMISDVPVGVFLSGGYDSSAVAAILQKHSSQKIKTFTIGFKEEKYNEAIYAKQVAQHLGTDHYEHYLSQKDALKILPRLPEIYDEPFGDSSAIPTIMVSEFAKQYVTVSLSADGGDELFSGYPSYKNTYDLYNKFHKFRMFNSLNVLDKIINPFQISKYLKIYNLEGKFYKFCELLKNSNSPSKFYETNTKYFYDVEIEKLLNLKLSSKETFFENSIDNMLSYSFKTYLNDDILTKVDRATMSVSLEGREPMLDFNLIEFVAQLPVEYKQKGNQTKYILKEIVHKYIPKELMERPKMGFSIPLFEWFRDELKVFFEEYLSQKAINESGIFNYKYIDMLKQSYHNGYGNPHKLWLILIFQMWWEKWVK
ncbi:asparagine synthase (glutamine-hydrolyzing) [Deferribacter abyssi]|uniref:asparagine synthase (glutamine-hydrolyzing) n=1 Tax=Deferribacter abyssi TaxID=213806 RepID=UPI003C257AD1